MRSDVAPHTLTIPADLFSQIAQAAAKQGKSPDQFALATLAATVTDPAWKFQLRAAQELSQQAFLESGLTEEEIGSDIDAEIKAYRAEHAAAVLPE